MLANNNRQVIRRMAKSSLLSNGRKSLIMIAAVVLSSFMLFSVLTVGVTYFKMHRIQNLRLHGAEYDAIMYGVTKDQQKMCEENADIKASGIWANAGYVMETENDSTANVGLAWADSTAWNTLMEPAREWVKGEYPRRADELMVTKEALKSCGMEELVVGDSIMLKYSNALDTFTKEFVISGMWAGYGEKKLFYVSEAFYEQSGYELSNVSSGRYFMDFERNIMTRNEQQSYIESMNLEKQQNVFFMTEVINSVEILIGIVGLILVTCLCAYLLIYNIMNLSVSGNIRYYGLLQTVGMTGKQVSLMLRTQMLSICSIGTGGGILLGGCTAFFLIPAVVKLLGYRSGKAGDIEVAFHPLIFAVTILLTWLTVHIGSRKPVKMASAVSPIEAVGYRASGGGKSIRKNAKGRLLYRMAREQLTRDKKKSGIVILSLAAGLTVFLCLITLIESQGARTILTNYMEMDMVIKNDTLKKEDRAEWMQVLDDRFMVTATNNNAVKEVNPVISAEIIVPWEPDFSDMWMKEFYDMWMTVPYEDDIEEYKAHPENFGSFLIGINEREFDFLNSTLAVPVDKDGFMDGRLCILNKDGLDFQPGDLIGKNVSCAEYADAGNTKTFEIGGLTDESYYSGAFIGSGPTIIVIDAVVKDLVYEPLIYKVGIKYGRQYDMDAEASLLSLMQSSPNADDFSYESKLAELETVEEAQGNMMEIGMGIVLILAFIGIMNYMNTVTGNIQSRQTDLAILEGLGMTDKQVDRMLIMEGLLYAGCSILLTAVAGTGITYWLYQSMNYRGIPFSVPVLPVLLMLVIIVLVCTFIPLAARHALIKKRSVVERINGWEQ